MELKHKYKPQVPQVHYYSYYDENVPKDYFATIDRIAEIIGTALENRNYTIRVYQWKEKFGGVRVYCTLADEDLTNSLVIPSSKIKETRIIEDSRWYRQVYMNVLNLFPQYHEAIIDCADHQYLLCYSKEELDEVIHLAGRYSEDNINQLYRIYGYKQL
jgi:hypothetical protein